MGINTATSNDAPSKSGGTAIAVSVPELFGPLRLFLGLALEPVELVGEVVRLGYGYNGSWRSPFLGEHTSRSPSGQMITSWDSAFS